MRRATNKHADLLDSFWCLVFTLTSIGVGLWFYWDMTAPIQRL